MAAASSIPLVAGNWKMNGLRRFARRVRQDHAGAAQLARQSRVDGVPSGDLDSRISPPRREVRGVDNRRAGLPRRASGAHTGDISAEMLADAGAGAVIVGHSERRADHHETDAMVRAKAQAACRAGLTAIVCVGEQRAEREAGKTLDVVGRQLDGSLPDGATRQSW